MTPRTAFKVFVSAAVISATAILPGGISGMQGTPKPTVTVYKSPT
jgi:hypothetical protein